MATKIIGLLMSGKEDTLRLLKKISFEQIHKEYNTSIVKNKESLTDSWFEERGWTIIEFSNALWKRWNL